MSILVCQMRMNILVCCHGNINRSPLCAAVLHHELADEGFNIRGAALKPWKRPERTPLKMREQAARLGYENFIEQHRSQPCTIDLLRWAGLVIIFDNPNQRRLEILLNQMAETERPLWRKLGEYCTPPCSRIADPAYFPRGGEALIRVADQIVDGARCLADRLRKGAL